MRKPAVLGGVLVCALAASACGDDAVVTADAARWDAVPADAGVDAGPPACEHVPAPAAHYRLFAVGHKVLVAEAESAAAYQAALRATIEAEVVPSLATDRPNLLVFPEDVGLVLAFLGARGETARAQTTVYDAMLSMIAPLTDAMGYYAEIDPSLPLGKQLLLAVTDPVWRTFDDTFSRIAADYGVYVVASTNVGDVEVTTDPLAETALGDPERPAGAPVYWVPDLEVYNQSVLWGPDGAIVAKLRKQYLVDMEIRDLGMDGGLPDRMGPVVVADGGLRLGAVISRDAWMQDALDRLALRGADVLLQHEAFSSVWASGADVIWVPDNLKRSGWGAVQKLPEVRYAAAPMLVGNFFDVPFDGQTFIAADGTPGVVDALVGQDPDVGWAAIAPWVMADPGTGNLQVRRAALEAAGAELLPGGANDNGYVEGVAWVDVDLPADDGHPVVEGAAAPGVLGPSRAIAPSGVGRQRNIAATACPVGVLAAWEDTRSCTGQIMVSRSADAGATWTAPIHVDPTDRPQHSPSLAASSCGQLYLAWQDVLGPDRAEIRVAWSEDGGLDWAAATSVDPGATVEAWRPALAWVPGGGTLAMAFIDARDGAPNRRVHFTETTGPATTFFPVTRLDPRDFLPADLDPTYTNEWSPSVSASGNHVVVAYSHRQRPVPEEQPSHDAFVTESFDGGDTWSAPLRLDDGGFPERLASDLVVKATLPSWVAAWSSLRAGGADSDVAVARGGTAGLLFVPDADPPRDQWHPSIAQYGEGWVVVWQDLRDGTNHIYLSRLAADGTFGPAIRVDDAPPGAHAWRPEVVTVNTTVHVFWEDSRTGHAEVRVASGVLPAE